MSDMTVLHQTFDFSGCKIALLHGDTILTILRDDISTIPYPNMWDSRRWERKGRDAF